MALAMPPNLPTPALTRNAELVLAKRYQRKRDIYRRKEKKSQKKRPKNDAPLSTMP